MSFSVDGNDHSCPDARPHPRGTDACDSCPWEETLEQYQAGELSTVRPSEIFDHSIRVSVVCDVGRPIDVDDVFEKITATERTFQRMFDRSIEPQDGDEVMLEVITGICDYGNGVDDCVMYTVCREGGIGGGCAVSSGQAHANAGGVATHATFVPWLPEGTWWWAEGNRYANLQHEFAHLLDYTYLRKDAYRGTDLNWWVEGVPQFIQWTILKDRLSWDRGNDDARLLETFTHRWNTSDYYDGMRAIAYLEANAPYLLEAIATEVRGGIYRHQDRHVAWHNLMGHIAVRHQWFFDQYVESISTSLASRPSRESADVVGVVEGVSEPEYVDPDRTRSGHK